MSKKSPWPTIVLGLGMFLIGLVLILLEVTATEAASQGLTYINFQPSFEILGQLPGLVAGSNAPALIPSILLAWGVELSFLIMAVGYDLARDAAGHANAALVGLLKTGIGIAVIIDWWTNYQYTTGFAHNNLAWRLIIACFMCYMVLLFPIVGFRLLEHGVRQFWAGGHSTNSNKPAMVPVARNN